MQLNRLAVAGRQDNAHTIALGNLPALSRLVEQVYTHRRGKFLLQFGVYAVHLFQLELLPYEPLSLWCHVLERI